MEHPENLNSPWSSYFVDEIEFGQDYGLIEKLTKASKTVYSFEARRKLGRLIDDLRPDVAHLHNIYHHLSPSVLGVLTQRRIPSVLTLHDLKLACPAYKMLATDGLCERCKGGAYSNVVRQRCIKDSVVLSGLVYLEASLHKLLRSYEKHVDKFVVPSKFYGQKMVEWGWSAERFHYVPNFVDSRDFEPVYQPGKHFLYFGRLSSEKGVLTLMKAVAKAGVSLRIAGVGPDEPALRKQAAASNADVAFLGFLSGQELHDEIASARAVVLPSEWYENAPVSIMEAYALGKIVLGADIGGIPEMLRDGETGFVFPSGSVDALAELLLRTDAMGASQIQEMGRASRAWVAEEFTAERYRESMVSIYRNLGVNASSGQTL